MKQQIAAHKLRLDNDLALTPDQCTAPTAEMLTTRMLFALAARLNLKVHSGDIPSAYLQAPITSDLYNIYLEQPAGMIVPGKEDWLMKLNDTFPNQSRNKGKTKKKESNAAGPISSNDTVMP